MTQRRKVQPAPDPSHIVREDEWGPLGPGVVFRATGEGRSRFLFKAFVTNTKIDSQWVEAYELERGGTRIVRSRSFPLGRIKGIDAAATRAVREAKGK